MNEASSANAMIRLYLDEDVTPVLARILRERGVDVTSALELGHIEWDDEAHLEFAVSEGRTLLTYNIRDFVQLHKKWQSECKAHNGIIVSYQFSMGALGEVLRRILKLLSVWAPETINNQLLFLGK